LIDVLQGDAAHAFDHVEAGFQGYVAEGLVGLCGGIDGGVDGFEQALLAIARHGHEDARRAGSGRGRRCCVPS
jgi:hypothetical protein